MRKGLQPYLGQRIAVTAQVIDFGSRIGWTGMSERTILLGPVRGETGAILTDHVWMRLGRQLAALDLKPGDTVSFTARVSLYYRGRTAANRAASAPDYQLVYPTRCVVLARWWSGTPSRRSRSYLGKSLPSARTQVLFAIAVLTIEEPEPPSLTKVQARAGVAPQAFLSVVKRLGRTGDIRFSPNGRVALAGFPVNYALS